MTKLNNGHSTLKNSEVKLASTPWKIWNEVRRLCIWPAARFQFWWLGIPWGKNWQLYGLPIIQKHHRSQIILGNNLTLRSEYRSNPLSPFHPVVLSTREKNARIEIGHHFGMTGGSIIAEESVRIGNNVIVGANTIIMDTDFHPLTAKARQKSPMVGKKTSVTIENNVFIGTQVIILKGTRIGANSVIGAGSVVAGIIPKNVIAAGNPAKIIRKLRNV